MALVQSKKALAMTSQVEQQRDNLISPLIVVRNKIEMMIYVKKVPHKLMLCTVVSFIICQLRVYITIQQFHISIFVVH